MERASLFILILTLAFIGSASACGPGWEARNNFCYLFEARLSTWASAESFCQTQGGHLVSFTDAGERDWVYGAHIGPSGQKWWIGLNDLQTENVFAWSDSTPYQPSIALWGSGEPNDNNGEHCTSYDGGNDVTRSSWSDENCALNRYFVCKATVGAATGGEVCDTDQGFEQFDTNCYLHVTNSMTWSDANAYCYTHFNAYLTSVTSDAENTYLASKAAISTSKDLWIGLSDSEVPGTFQWSNGHDLVGYENWDIPPTIIHAGSTCVEMLATSGFWNTTRCGVENTFVCKKGLKTSCPDGWIYGHGKCYEFHLNPSLYVTWTDARDFCALKNARILQIKTQDEQNFISAFYQQWKSDGILQMWLGVSDVNHDQILRWSDDTVVSYQQWDGDVTSKLNPGDDDCAWIYTGKTSQNWEIGNCFQLQAFACEIPEGVNLSPLPKPLLNYTCSQDNPWRLFNGFCYLFPSDKLDFDGSENYCNQALPGGGHLVSIHNEAEQSFVSGHMRGQSWSGLNDRVFEGSFQWIDQTPLDFTNWKFNQPDQKGDCIRIVGVDTDSAWGTWNDRDCSEIVFPVCKIAATPTDSYSPSTVDPDPHESLCGINYIHNAANHKCYKIEATYPRQWADARIHCQQEGGDLLSINTPEEQSFIEFYITYLDAIGFWTGGIDSYNGPDALPDVVADAFDGGWRWIDGSPFNFVNWMGGQPDDDTGEDCVQIRTDQLGLWNDVSCASYHGYICEKDDPEHPPEEPASECTSEDCCFRHLGVEVGGSVLDEQLSASSQQYSTSSAQRGRLNTLDQHLGLLDVGPGLGAWIPNDNDPAPWIQVDLLDLMEIRGVITQGRNGLSQPDNQNDWSRKFSVQYRINKALGTWEDYKELDGSVKVYDGNFDQDTQVTNIFSRPVVSSGIRILPKDCRRSCSMRIEIIGCKATCVASLGVSKDAFSFNFPILPDNQMTASSQQAGSEAYYARLDYSSGDMEDQITYTRLGSDQFTYDSARAECMSAGGDLCTRDEVCPQGIPYPTGILAGDQWAPIRDGYNDWVQVGDDNGAAGRICQRHNDLYGAPGWGLSTGDCSNWATPEDPCPHKGSLYCCTVNDKSWKPVTNSATEWLQVDLGQQRKVSGVLVQGDSQSDAWMTSYQISFSVDGSIFITYKSMDGTAAVFPGSVDRNTPVEGFFREALSAQFIRILPQTWNNEIALRMDVVGCEIGELVTCTDQPQNYADTSFVVDCPAGCQSVNDYLWGTTVYTDDSYICAAAVHDGRIVGDHGGTVTVKKERGLESYDGSTQHGVTSQSYGSWPGSFTFQGDHLGCPTGWDGWQDSCYYLTRRSSKVSYEEARTRCQFYGAELASIHSEGEQAFVTNLIFYGYGSIDDVWIGMNDFDRVNYFRWSDGSDVTFTRWNFNEPNGGDSERCVHMYKWSGFWNDARCDNIMNYVCKMDKIPINQAQEEVDGCKHGWLGNGASCYLFDINPSVWTNAESFCNKQGGNLAAVNNYYEQAYLTSQAAQTSHPNDDMDFFIGLSAYIDQTGAMTFKWSSGQPVTFTAWGQDEPFIAHQCVFPFLYQGVSYYSCISFGRPYELLGGPWCSADPVYSNHPVPCEGREDGQVGCIVMNKDTGYWSQASPVGCGSPNYRICETPREGYTTPQAPTLPSPNGNCPDGWYGWSNGTFCYQINELTDITKRLSWEHAKLHCESQGSNLASIHSYQEELIIQTGIAGNDYSFWIGLKRQPDGLMGWSDKTPLSYTHWDTGEPNNQNGREECVVGTFLPDNIYWSDVDCNAARSWLCKIQRGKDLLPALTPPPGTLSPQICGSDAPWVAYTSEAGKQKCYTFVSSPLLGWQSANQQCQAYGGTLVSIAAPDEQQFIMGYAHKSGVSDLWIGLIQDGINGPFLWADRTPVVFQNWANGQPNNNNGHELCVEMMADLGVWRDNNCGFTNGFICQKNVGASPVDPTPAPVLEGGCPTDWIPYGGKCFLEVGFTDTSLRAIWNESREYCESKGGFIASLPNPYYNAFITSRLFASTSGIWIGLSSQGNNRVFVWADNSEVLFTNWAPGEPNNAEGIEHCVELYWQSDNAGKWNDKRCDEVRPFYCSRDKNPEFPLDPTTSAPDCPPNQGFVQWDTGCYKTYTQPSDYRNWHDARGVCTQEGARLGITEDLTSVWNIYENSFLMSLFWPQETEPTSYETTWLGMYYNHTEDGQTNFMWSDHSPMSFTLWDTNQPQETGESTGCAVMSRFGLWSMYKNSGGSSCQSTTLPFVCKYETLTIPVQDPGVGTCEPNWVGLGENCYFVVQGISSSDQRTWGDANAECQSRNGFLASIHSDIENKAFVSWTGERNTWIGLLRNGWGGWDWQDNSPVDFTNWAPGEPNNYGDTGEACVELYTSGGWNDIFCTESKGYICQKHKQYSTCTFPLEEREDCGYPGITQYECQKRLCCYDESNSGPHLCYYSRADSACLEKGGACMDYEANVCELGYEQYLCGGGGDNRCCFECDQNDETCKNEVAGWESNDSPCESNNYGKCQYNSNFCASQVYETGKCGGPGLRQCCVTNPVTKPTEGPLTTTTPGDPGGITTTPGDAIPTTTTTNGQQSTSKSTTEDHTEVELPPPGGLDAGGIAGIVIAVIFVTLAVVVGVVVYQRTQQKNPFNAKLFSGSPQSSVSGFDNPITYTKAATDSVEFGEVAYEEGTEA